MDAMNIQGGIPLRGQVRISGSKNAALPLLCATLLSSGKSILHHVPTALRDLRTVIALLRFLGLEVVLQEKEKRLTVEGVCTRSEAPYELVKQMRASILVLGPLVSRYGRAKVSLPGGCAIGARPVDQHLKGLEAMGCSIRLERGYVIAEGPHGGGQLHGAEICFDIPTVGGTEHLMMAAALAKGETILINCAREPEIEELCRALQHVGVEIQGAGTDVIRIRGVDARALPPLEHTVMADRIEAGTYMIAAAACEGSEVLIENINLDHLEPLILKLCTAGITVTRHAHACVVRRTGPLHPVSITTAPHPGFPTDLQAQFLALMCHAQGESVITESIFENRFMHVPELIRMGACIALRGRAAVVQGSSLYGSPVMATDLRASASLVIAGLMAQGETEIRRIYHLDRGYEQLECKLAGIGARIVRVKDSTV